MKLLEAAARWSVCEYPEKSYQCRKQDCPNYRLLFPWTDYERPGFGTKGRRSLCNILNYLNDQLERK